VDFGNVPSVDPGTYTVTLTVNGQTVTQPPVDLEGSWVANR